jgi:hypothetical protein
MTIDRGLTHIALTVADLDRAPSATAIASINWWVSRLNVKLFYNKPKRSYDANT